MTESVPPLLAGFSRAKITPPLGTRMFGWGARDESSQGCESIHDDLVARALWLQQDREKALIISFDLLFLSRDIADRLRGAIARRFRLESRQIMLNCSHTHSGPATGTWHTALFSPPDRLYLDFLERSVLAAVEKAQTSLCPVTISVGAAKTNVAVRRRKPNGKGGVEWKPYIDGVYDAVPVCLLRSVEDEPVCLLFSVSCHPSTFFGHAISADYPGAAMAGLDEHFETPCSMFLQGVGGDSKIRSFANPHEFGRTWEDTEKAGQIIVSDVIKALDALKPVKPHLRCAEVEVELPMVKLPTKEEFQAIASDNTNHMKQMWAKNMIARLDQGEQLPTFVPMTVHGIRVGQGVRIVGLEAEPVAEWGAIIEGFYGRGFTFPLGYTDGCQLYLPTSTMLDEGGYEVNSYYEYGWPARLAAGIEDRVIDALQRLLASGVR